MTTKRGIELDLNESNYVLDLYGFRFYFSSKFYLRKFKNGVISFVNLENSKLRNRYKIPIFLNSYFAISFYKKITPFWGDFLCLFLFIVVDDFAFNGVRIIFFFLVGF